MTGILLAKVETAMLRSLTVGNFKSIGSDVEIELAPLTIVTGANSSGKSTLLQSLLLLLQTFRHSSSERQFVLNGPLTQLGEFDDILHAGSSSSREISIGIQVAPDVSADDSPQSLIKKARVPVFVDGRWNFTDRPLRPEVSQTEGKTFPTIKNLNVDGYFEGGENYSRTQIRIKRHSWAAERRRRVEGYETLPERSHQSLSWSVNFEPRFEGDVRGVLFDHCLPSAITTRVDLLQEVARQLLKSMILPSNTPVPSAFRFFEDLWLLVKENVIDPLDLDASQLGDKPSTAEVRRWQLKHSPVQRRRIGEKVRENLERVLAQYGSINDPQPWLFVSDLPDWCSRSVGALEDAITGLRYLGPLRVQPAPIYPVATTLGSEDVGPSGEWTASVLDAYRNKSVTFIHPDELPLSRVDAPTVTMPLAEAVRVWTRYLGVAESVETADRGSLGHELTVQSGPSERRLALTHVGVGVSQCLPVVVSLLLAPPGSMTLLEQPELHLHPAVQSRLGDFLLTMAASGRQCFVETHSEYLVNRLRLRIAEADGAEMSEQVSILFAERIQGRSSFRKVDVNQFGAIQDWPDGFFDDTQDDIELLLSASHRKRTVNARRP